MRIQMLNANNYLILLLYSVITVGLVACDQTLEVTDSKQSQAIPANKSKVQNNNLVVEQVPYLVSHKDSSVVIKQTVSNKMERERLQQRMWVANYYPSGLYLHPDSTLTLNVDIMEGTDLPRMVVGTSGRPVKVVELTQGQNTIEFSKGGLINLNFTTETDSDPTGRARIDFINGFTKAPLYVLGKTTHAEWLDMLANHVASPDVQLVSKRAMMVVSREKAVEYQDENQNKLLKTIDKIIKYEDEISGIDESSDLHMPNIKYYQLVEVNNGYMYATNNYTAYNTSIIDRILTVNGLINKGWGPWHELGHVHQQNAWTWGAVSEATVNVYSLAAERGLGITPSRVNTNGVWADVDTYFALPDKDRDFNSSSASDGIRMAMFHQLWLAFGDSFYQTLHKDTRVNKPTPGNANDRMRYFMLKSCEISGYDLSDFFKKWGLPVPDSVYDKIEALNLPTPSKDLTTLRD